MLLCQSGSKMKVNDKKSLRNKVKLRPFLAVCHPRRRVYAKGLCRSCYEKRLRQANPEYAERQRENSRQWARKYGERKKQVNRAWRAKKDKRWRRNLDLIRSHGITLAQYEAILRKQKGVCAICRKPSQGRALNVDHCHKTGTIRGLLCFRCNYGLGWFGDNSSCVRRMLKYLRRQVIVDNGVVHITWKPHHCRRNNSKAVPSAVVIRENQGQI